MKQPPHNSRQPGETLHSPALHLGSVAVRSRDGRRARPFGGTRLKAVIFPALHWLIRHVPPAAAMLPARLVTAALRLYYFVPGNRLRAACRAVTGLAGTGAERLQARQVYAAFLDNALGVLRNFFELYRHGSDRGLAHIALDPADAERINRLIATHGGAVLAVPHNVGSAFSALRIGHSFDMLLVARNPTGAARTRIALDFYERMQLNVLMVRDGNPFELARTLFSVLARGRLVAATLDNPDRSANRVEVNMFGRRVGLAGWAARIAARMQVPVIPAWFHSSGRELRVIVGEPLLSTDIPALVQHYAGFFERRILADPASWAYLADKRWQRILADATGAQAPSRPPSA